MYLYQSHRGRLIIALAARTYFNVQYENRLYEGIQSTVCLSIKPPHIPYANNTTDTITHGADPNQATFI